MKLLKKVLIFTLFYIGFGFNLDIIYSVFPMKTMWTSLAFFFFFFFLEFLLLSFPFEREKKKKTEKKISFTATATATFTIK